MLFIDDILLSPAKGLLFIFKKIHESVKAEMEDSPQKLQKWLREANMLLEAGQMSEQEYQKVEKHILQRISALKKGQST